MRRFVTAYQNCRGRRRSFPLPRCSNETVTSHSSEIYRLLLMRCFRTPGCPLRLLNFSDGSW